MEGVAFVDIGVRAVLHQAEGADAPQVGVQEDAVLETGPQVGLQGARLAFLRVHCVYGDIFFEPVCDRSCAPRHGMDPIIVIAGAVLGLDALFLAWVCGCEKEAKKQRHRRSGYVPV